MQKSDRKADLKHTNRGRTSTSATHTGPIHEMHRTCHKHDLRKAAKLSAVSTYQTRPMWILKMSGMLNSIERLWEKNQMVSKNYEILTRASRQLREDLHQISPPNSKVWPTRHVRNSPRICLECMSRFWEKIDFKSKTRPNQLWFDLRFCRKVHGSVEKISSEHQHLIPSKSQKNSKSIKKDGVSSIFLKRMDFRARVESAKTGWWEWFSYVLAHFDPTQKPTKARIQRNHQNQEKGDTERGRTPKPNQNEIDSDLEATRTRGG